VKLTLLHCLFYLKERTGRLVVLRIFYVCFFYKGNDAINVSYVNYTVACIYRVSPCLNVTMNKVSVCLYWSLNISSPHLQTVLMYSIAVKLRVLFFFLILPSPGFDFCLSAVHVCYIQIKTNSIGLRGGSECRNLSDVTAQYRKFKKDTTPLDYNVGYECSNVFWSSAE
jgi:hypothetical protein